MVDIHLSSTELARQIGDIMGRLHYRGESFIIERNGKPVARLIPYERAQAKDLRQILEAWLASGESDPEWAAIMEEARASDSPPEDPWASS